MQRTQGLNKQFYKSNWINLRRSRKKRTADERPSRACLRHALRTGGRIHVWLRHTCLCIAAGMTPIKVDEPLYPRQTARKVSRIICKFTAEERSLMNDQQTHIPLLFTAPAYFEITNCIKSGSRSIRPGSQ